MSWKPVGSGCGLASRDRSRRRLASRRAAWACARSAWARALDMMAVDAGPRCDAGEKRRGTPFRKHAVCNRCPLPRKSCGSSCFEYGASCLHAKLLNSYYMSPPPAAIIVNEPEVIRAPVNSWRRSPPPAAIMLNDPEVMSAPARRGGACACQTPPPAAIMVNEPEVIRAPANSWRRRSPPPAAIMVNDPEVMSAPWKSSRSPLKS